MAGYAWSNPTNCNSFRYYFSLFTISVQKNTDCLHPERLMIKELCNLIGEEHILVNNLKFWNLNFGKTLFFPKDMIDFSFWIIFNIVKLSKGTHTTSRQVWIWLGMPENTQSKKIVLDATFAPFKKKLKRSIHSFQIYQWSNNALNWLDLSILTNNLWSRNFPKYGISTRLHLSKGNDKTLWKLKKTLF